MSSEVPKMKLAKVLVGAPLRDSPISVEWAAEGGAALLPCNITAPEGDSLQLIIFYKAVNPIYSVDARSEPLSEAVHWVSPQVDERHPRFEMSPPLQGLVLLRVTAGDEDEYHCRVDFHESPTRNVRVRLNVASAPTNLVIRNEAGIEVNGMIGPYPLGGVLRLTCQADGGRPSPVVAWYEGGRLLDDEMEAVSEESASNTLSVTDLGREHLFMALSCRATTHNLTREVVAAVKLDLTYPPEVSLRAGARIELSSMKEGDDVYFECRVAANPPAHHVTWFRDIR